MRVVFQIHQDLGEEPSEGENHCNAAMPWFKQNGSFAPRITCQACTSARLLGMQLFKKTWNWTGIGNEGIGRCGQHFLPDLSENRFTWFWFWNCCRPERSQNLVTSLSQSQSICQHGHHGLISGKKIQGLEGCPVSHFCSPCDLWLILILNTARRPTPGWGFATLPAVLPTSWAFLRMAPTARSAPFGRGVFSIRSPHGAGWDVGSSPLTWDSHWSIGSTATTCTVCQSDLWSFKLPRSFNPHRMFTIQSISLLQYEEDPQSRWALQVTARHWKTGPLVGVPIFCYDEFLWLHSTLSFQKKPTEDHASILRPTASARHSTPKIAGCGVFFLLGGMPYDSTHVWTFAREFSSTDAEIIHWVLESPLTCFCWHQIGWYTSWWRKASLLKRFSSQLCPNRWEVFPPKKLAHTHRHRDPNLISFGVLTRGVARAEVKVWKVRKKPKNVEDGEGWWGEFLGNDSLRWKFLLSENLRKKHRSIITCLCSGWKDDSVWHGFSTWVETNHLDN